MMSYENVMPSLSGCRHATWTSLISPLCPTMSVNASGRLHVSYTFSNAPEVERSARVQEIRLPLLVRIWAGKFVAKRRSSRRSCVTVVSSKVAATSDQYVNDLADLRVLRGWGRRLLFDSYRHGLPTIARHAVPNCLELGSAEHREVIVSRNAYHLWRLHSARLLSSRIKECLKANPGRSELCISGKMEVPRG